MFEHENMAALRLTMPPAAIADLHESTRLYVNMPTRTAVGMPPGSGVLNTSAMPVPLLHDTGQFQVNSMR